ncbi:MAG: outer membrane beta-barrel protein [Deltaproteobacteria bacterium]|nr:outer membrane beta-barrel protein [Deltaproteobacteria bacterium]MBI3293677.1 outer membrane beta-barrel protein [Deltaproteobacteria bacterium]
MATKWVFLLALLAFAPSAQALELFAKGSYSKYYYDLSTWEENITGSGGLALGLTKGIRLEARSTYIQKLENQIEIIVGGNPVNISSRTTKQLIYSLGVDVDLLGSKSSFQPYLYFGAGIIQYATSYKMVDAADINSLVTQKYSGNVGLGFRWMLGRTMALELEAMGYATDIDKPQPLINTLITAGLRLFIG